MSRHSKNNTSRPIFTYAERQKLKDYGTIKQRLGKDSLKDFDACSLCLHNLVMPLACPQGHLFCKECIYSALLSQKKEIKRQTKLYKLQGEKYKEEEQLKKDQEQHALLEKLDQAERGETVTATTAEEKKKVASYWVPSVAPQAVSETIKKPSKQTTCPEGKHAVALKDLISVQFTVNASESEQDKFKYMCPVCKKTLNNTPKVVLMKSCGHVICVTCHKQFGEDKQSRGEGKCAQCGEEWRGESEVIPLASEGTGHAGHSSKIQATVVTVRPSF
jgi:nitric oxide synthase-interacting protein